MTATIEQNRVSAELAKASVSGNVLHVTAPEGGALSRDGNVTGAIKIRLPQRSTNTMIKFDVEVFDYATGKTVSYTIAGYNYGSGNWINVTATMTGGSNATKAVRFGNDGVKDCVWIGDLNSVWSYPKIRVTNLIAGHYNYSANQWRTGWQVSIVTAFDTVQHNYDTQNPAKSVDKVAADLTSERTARTSADEALGRSVDTVTARIGNAESSISTTSQAVANLNGTVSAMHTIKTQTIAGGRTAIAGISMGTNGSESSVIVMADKFGIVANAQDGNVKPMFSVINNQVAVNGDLIADGTVSARMMAANSVQAGAIATGVIRANHVAAGEISTEKLASGAVTTEKIRSNTITSDKIGAGQITTNHMVAGSIDAAALRAGTVTATHIASRAITTEKMNVQSLSAISANLGTMTAGSIQGVTITGNTISGNTITGGSISGTNIIGTTITGGTITGARLEGATGRFTGELEVTQLIGGNIIAHITAQFTREKTVSANPYNDPLGASTYHLLEATINFTPVSTARYIEIIDVYKSTPFLIPANTSHRVNVCQYYEYRKITNRTFFIKSYAVSTSVASISVH